MATSSHPSGDGRTGPLKDTRTQLFVGNLPYRVRWQDLKDLFRRAGTVLRADVSLGPDNRSRGYGTVLLATAEDAGRAIDIFNGYSWQTRILEVRPDRLPPDFDTNIAPGYPSGSGTGPVAVSVRASSSSTPFPDDLEYSSLLDHYHNFPNVSGPPCRNLFVGNLPFHCQWQDLKDLFRQAGTIIRADVALGQDGRSRGFGTVVFATEQDAERAVQLFNGYEYNGRPLKVNYDKYMQILQPNALLPNITGTSLGSIKSPASPTPSLSSNVPDSRIPILSHARQVSSHNQPGQPGKPSLPFAHHLDLASTFKTSSPFERWGSHQAIAIQHADEQDRVREPEEREWEVRRYFRQLDLESRPPSTLPISLHPPPTTSRSASVSSTKPPSLATTTSSRSTISSSTSNTSENSEPCSSDRPRLSSSSRSVASTSLSKSPSLHSTRSRNNQHLSSHHPSPHPHHPGPIALPPPPPVTAFPLGHGSHTLSPHGMMHVSLSPLHHPLGSPSSPPYNSHHHHQHQHQPSQVPVTPHGLPPITPSMPSFNFLPPLTTMTNTNNLSMSQVQPASSIQMTMPMTPMRPSRPHSQSDEQRRHAFSLASINGYPFAQTPPATGNGNNVSGTHPNGYGQGMTAFSPSTMSPGAFWGRPGTSAVNPMINPAVGAPVHMHHGGSPTVHPGHMHSPGHHGYIYSPGHGDMFYGDGVGQGMREPAGYFDPGYFPPMGYTTGSTGTSTTFIENEILKPKDRRESDDGVEKPYQEEVVEEEGKEEDSPLDGEEEKLWMSLGATWGVKSGASDEDTRGWEGRERRAMDGVGLAQKPDAMVTRTHSMLSKTSAGSRMLPIHRSDSAPTANHSHAAEDRGEDPQLRVDDAGSTDSEGQSAELKPGAHSISVS